MSFKNNFKDTLPVLAGYIVLGMGFGMIMNSQGYGILWSVPMSIFIYAGSMQYAAVGLITGGASLLTFALTTLAVNARHFFYGISMTEKYKKTGWAKPYLIFALTDETYSLVCCAEREKNYYLTVSLMNHSYWVAGTALGAILGETVKFDATGMDFALTALFLTVFCEQWTHGRDRFSALTGVSATLVCLLIFGKSDFLIPSMVLILAVLLIRWRIECKIGGASDEF